MLPVVLLSLTGEAAAQALSWQFVAGAVLSPDPGISFMSQSIGAPSVVWESDQNRFRMIFESRTPTTDPGCPAGVWALGFATSTDGVNWTASTTAALMPVPGSGDYWQCVAAHPTMLYQADPDGAGPARAAVFAWFKAEDGTGNVAIGRARWNITSGGLVSAPSVSPAVWTPAAGSTIGYPKMTQVGSQFRLLVQNYPDIWLGLSTVGTSITPTVSLTRADAALDVYWADNELFNPASICQDDPTNLYDNVMFVGGRDTNFGVVVEGAWSKALRDIPNQTWILSTDAEQTWLNNDEWRHWDVHKLFGMTSTDEYAVWFSEKDASGNSFIRHGATTLGFAGTDLVAKRCPP